MKSDQAVIINITPAKMQAYQRFFISNPAKTPKHTERTGFTIKKLKRQIAMPETDANKTAKNGIPNTKSMEIIREINISSLPYGLIRFATSSAVRPAKKSPTGRFARAVSSSEYE